MQVIAYPNTNGGVAVVYPASEFLAAHGLRAVAEKDVPAGVPYRFLPAGEVPTELAARDAWVLDFANPDGHGGAAQ